MGEAYRIEKDLLGELELPADVLYGIQTERARRNFDLSDVAVRPELVQALARVKLACAEANMECGLDAVTGRAIIAACEEIIAGEHADSFVVNSLQGGAGTSTHMNVNEVIARRASTLCGQPVDPFDHVNLHQSTNDVYPTAVRVAVLIALPLLEQSIGRLLNALQDREREFAGVVKLGRTQLRDAIPITLGREFGAYAGAIARDRWRISKCVERIRVVNLGGTAIGTGMNAPRTYIFGAIEKLRSRTGLGLTRAENLVDATQNLDAFVEVSGIIRTLASNLTKIANDLRLLSSGPEGGLGEIELPAVQPGSTIMPGKINPVIPEMVMQVAFRVMAHDYEINLAVMRGELELNAFMPLIADAMLDSLALLERTCTIFAERCITGIKANEARCRTWMERSPEIVAALIPRIGHERATELARQMRDEGLDLRTVVARTGWITTPDLENALSAETLCALGWRQT